MSARFVPPFPPRGQGPVAVWRGLFGERARTAVYGWSEAAFSGPSMRRKVLGFTVIIPLEPAEVQHVLLDNAANYAKPDIVKSLLGPVIGRGLLTSDGDLWRSQRKIVAATFAPAAVDALAPAFTKAALERMSQWRAGERIDMAAEATVTTMTIIADTLFGGDQRLKTDAGRAHIEAAIGALGEARIQALLGLPTIAWSGGLRRGRRGQDYLRKTLADVVRDRLRQEPRDDFLGRLITALGKQFDAPEALGLAVDNAATFYLAGHETTANALTWTLYLLAAQPALQAEAAEEARTALTAGEDGLTDRLPLLRAILDESLRLYPPVPRFDRQALGPDRIGDVDVAAGDIVSIWPWLLHRRKALWDDADAFDPKRFAIAGRARHRFQYIPFGGGPRLCVGARFATVEALHVLAHWLSDWSFVPAGDQPVKLSGMATLRPAGGLALIAERRA
ncbi:MAG: cytochrome P450 [Sphingomicrobium sp.]